MTTPSPSQEGVSPTPTRFAGISLDEIKAMVLEELKNLADGLLQDEVEKQIDAKISDRRIGSMQRTRVHKKVLDDVRKRIVETDLFGEIMKEQSELHPEDFDPDNRVSDDITEELRTKIEDMVTRSMEIAIADELFQKIKVEKLTKVPEVVEPKLGAFGVRHAQVLMVLLFLAISFIQRVDITVAIVALKDNVQANPDYRDFGWDESVQGLILSSFYWGYFFVQIPGGILAEKYGPKLVMTASMILCASLALFMPAVTLLTGWLGLYTLKVLQGISQGAFIPAVYVFTAKWIPPNEKAKLFTPAFGGMQLGTVVGLPITGFLCGSYVGWPFTFFFSAMVGYVWVIAWVFVAANSPAVHRSISREEQLYIEGSFGFGEVTLKGAKKTIPWKDIITSKPFIGLMIGHFGENWIFFTLISELPIYFSAILKVDITQNSITIAMIYFIGWMMILMLAFLSSYLHDKQLCSLTVERKSWTSIALYGIAIIYFIIGFYKTESYTLLISLFTFIIALNSAIYNGLFSNHADLSPNYVGILMGLSNTFGNLSSLLAPLFVGFVVTDETDQSQWATVFYAAAAVAAICNTIFLIFGSTEIQPWNTPPNLHEHLTEDATIGSSRHLRGYMVSDSSSVAEDGQPFHRNSV